jgi:TonB family protein
VHEPSAKPGYSESRTRYPEEDRIARKQGTVAIYAIIDKSGAPQRLQVVSRASPSLDQESLEAIRKWRYEGATCAGTAVDIETVIEVHFVLSAF